MQNSAYGEHMLDIRVNKDTGLLRRPLRITELLSTAKMSPDTATEPIGRKFLHNAQVALILCNMQCILLS
jgi:hypothetical protein